MSTAPSTPNPNFDFDELSPEAESVVLRIWETLSRLQLDEDGQWERF